MHRTRRHLPVPQICAAARVHAEEREAGMTCIVWTAVLGIAGAMLGMYVVDRMIEWGRR